MQQPPTTHHPAYARLNPAQRLIREGLLLDGWDEPPMPANFNCVRMTRGELSIYFPPRQHAGAALIGRTRLTAKPVDPAYLRTLAYRGQQFINTRRAAATTPTSDYTPWPVQPTPRPRTPRALPNQPTHTDLPTIHLPTSPNQS